MTKIIKDSMTQGEGMCNEELNAGTEGTGKGGGEGEYKQ